MKILFLMVLLGAVLMLLMKADNVKGKINPNILTFIGKNWKAFLINIIIGVGVILMQDDIKTFLPDFELNKAWCFMIGFAGQQFWQMITDIFNSKKKTYIDLSKNFLKKK